MAGTVMADRVTKDEMGRYANVLAVLGVTDRKTLDTERMARREDILWMGVVE